MVRPLCIARFILVFLTCDEELLGEGAAVEGCDLLLQAHRQNAGTERGKQAVSM